MAGWCKGKGEQRRKCSPDFSECVELDEIGEFEQLAVFWCPTCNNNIMSALPYDQTEKRAIYNDEYAHHRWHSHYK